MTIAEKQTTQTGLPLESLRVQGYRAFKDLTIPKLARVNLITGKNNVGKTSLLEVLHLFARRGSPRAFWTVLSQRTPLVTHSISETANASSLLVNSVVRVFEGSRLPDSVTQRASLRFSIGVAGEDPLSVQVIWPHPNERHGVQINTNSKWSYDIIGISDPSVHLSFESDDALTSNLISSQRMDRSGIAGLWDDVALTALKDEILAGLKLLDSSVIDLNFLGDAVFDGGRYPYVRRTGDFYPVPLSQMGEGMNRLLDVLVALTNSSDGILLLDEIENGIHYSVLTDVWKAVFDLALRLNVQVFATTHSWECIEAFQKAASESEADGALIRLQNKDGNIQATVFDERRLAIVTRDQIEVR